MSSSPVVLKSSFATWSAAVVAFILFVAALYHAVAIFSPLSVVIPAAAILALTGKVKVHLQRGKP